MDKNEIIEKLRDDDNYYGEFGQQFLSNSNIMTLLENPLQLGTPSEKTVPLVFGGYFHTALLEPEKLVNYKVIDSSTRGTNKYKEEADGDICILQHEVDKIQLMKETLLGNEIVANLIQGEHVEYEVPAVAEIEGNMWKGKADILNHGEKLIIDLKTTSDIEKFKWSANKYNYDSQAYIYQKLFGYEMLFIVICKKTNKIGIYDCSDEFYERGYEKVVSATEVYELFYKTEGFDPKQFFINQTL